MLKAIFVCLSIALRVGCASLAFAVCLPVTAQQLTPDQTRCLNKGKEFSLDVQISGCTAVLQSDRVSAGNLTVAAYLLRGTAYFDKGDYDRAIADLNNAIRLNPGLPGAHNNRGVVYEKKGDHDRAIADYSEAIRINPSYAAAYSNRGNLLEAGGLREEAIADFRRALAIDPTHQPARDALKRIEAKGGIVMYFVYLAVVPILGVLVLFVIYRILPHRSLSNKKPVIAFFPKYVFPISNEEARVNLKNIGFKPHKSPDVYVRGHYWGDFSFKLARLSVILDGNTAYLQTPTVLLFDTGDLWKIAKEVHGPA